MKQTKNKPEKLYIILYEDKDGEGIMMHENPKTKEHHPFLVTQESHIKFMEAAIPRAMLQEPDKKFRLIEFSCRKTLKEY